MTALSPPAAAAPDIDSAKELESYYSNKPLMWRNVTLLALLNIGWSICFTAVGPLMQLRLNSAGFNEGALGLIGSVNGWVVSFLVMYFSWKSDHTVSRWGRRIPYLWISAPIIVLTVFLFPYFENKWLLLALMALQMLFMDMKNSTISLLPIDLVPRKILARTNSVQTMALGLVGFLALRYGMSLADLREDLPYLIGGAAMLLTSVVSGLFLKEPPIRKQTTERFKPWSAIQIGFRDRKLIFLMVGLALLNSFSVMYNMWIWLFAKNTLNLTRADMGAAMSWAPILSLVLAFPYAWLIDRFNPYKILICYLTMTAGLCVGFFYVQNGTHLAIMAILWVVTAGLSYAGPMIMLRTLPPADVGSITASAAFINNAYIGTLGLVSGLLIERLGQNYRIAYLLGLGLSLAGFGVILIYRHLLLASRDRSEVPLPGK